MSAIELVLTDDWELFGDGSGDMRHVQFDSLRTLTRIYEEHGLRGSFNAEVMQQLHHLQEGEKHPRLRDLANEWSSVLQETLARGHDVQLHVHPQWCDARYDNGVWLLSGDWTLGNHPVERVRAMLRQGKHYLEELLREVDSSYQCVSFRAGAWALAPSPTTVPALIEAGLKLDISIAPGMIKIGEVRVDYSKVSPELLPYYPELDDARQIADRPQPLICVPTHTFDYTPKRKLFDTLSGQGKRFSSGTWSVRVKSLVRHHVHGTHYVSDLSTLTYPQMRWMMEDMRHKAGRSGSDVVPVVITNHTKDLKDFSAIRSFARMVAEATDVRVITLQQLATHLAQGRYPIRVARMK